MSTTPRLAITRGLGRAVVLLAACLPLQGCFWVGHFAVPYYRKAEFDGMFFGSRSERPADLPAEDTPSDGSDFYRFGTFGTVAEDESRSTAERLLNQQQGGSAVGARFVIRTRKNPLAAAYEMTLAWPLEVLFLLIPQEVPWYYGLQVESWPLFVEPQPTR